MNRTDKWVLKAERRLRALYWAKLVLLAFGLLALLLLTTSCAGNPSRTVPKGFPFPRHLGPQLPSGVASDLDQLRCMGSFCKPRLWVVLQR